MDRAQRTRRPLLWFFVVLGVVTATAVAIGVWGMGGSSADAKTSAKARAKAARSFAFAIGDGAGRRDLSRYGLIVVDGEGTSAAQVKRLRRRGAIVLAYVSVGTIEKGRGWHDVAAPYKMELWEDWGEWYADVANPGFRKVIVERVAPSMLKKGFDGLFLDNVDMIESHSAQRAGMLALVKSLSKLTHKRGGLLFMQNGDAIVKPLTPYIDGWNREDVTGTYDFDSETYRAVSASDTASAVATGKRMKKAGKVVTFTDYARSGDSAAIARSRKAACAAGAIPFVSDIGLTRVPSTPVKC